MGDQLRRCYNKAGIDPDDRSKAPVTSPAPSTCTNLFAEAAQVARSPLESDDDVFCPSNMIMKTKTSAEKEDRQRETQGNTALYFKRE